jgi:hypothetical protein
MLPQARNFDWTATPHDRVPGSYATTEKVDGGPTGIGVRFHLITTRDGQRPRGVSVVFNNVVQERIGSASSGCRARQEALLAVTRVRWQRAHG